MENINFLIVGKPNSGKSTFYNTLNNKYLSPTGPESGLTKDIFKNEVSILDTKFTFFDTPGLRRKNKIDDKDEIKLTYDVINLIDKIDVVFLLVDATENLTKQDLKIAEIVIKRKKILFIVFNKIDLIDPDELNRLKKLYPGSLFISAFKKIKIVELLSGIQNQLSTLNVITNIHIPYDKLHVIDYIYKNCKVLKRIDEYDKVILKIETSPSIISKLKHKIKQS